MDYRLLFCVELELIMAKSVGGNYYKLLLQPFYNFMAQNKTIVNSA